MYFLKKVSFSQEKVEKTKPFLFYIFSFIYNLRILHIKRAREINPLTLFIRSNKISFKYIVYDIN